MGEYGILITFQNVKVFPPCTLKRKHLEQRHPSLPSYYKESAPEKNFPRSCVAEFAKVRNISVWYLNLRGVPGKLAIPSSGGQCITEVVHCPTWLSRAQLETAMWAGDVMEKLSQCGKFSSSLGRHLVWIRNKLSTTGASLTGFDSPSTDNLEVCKVLV